MEILAKERGEVVLKERAAEAEAVAMRRKMREDILCGLGLWRSVEWVGCCW